MNVTDQLELACEDLLRLTHVLPDVIRRIRDALPGQPGAASYDGAVSAGSHADPTQDAALELVEGNTADADLATVKRRVAVIAREADALVHLAAAWQSRGPTRKEQRETAVANEPGCELHAKAGLHAPRDRVVTKAGGWVPPRPVAACAACRRFMAARKRLPSTADVEYHHNHGHWPHLLAHELERSQAS